MKQELVQTQEQKQQLGQRLSAQQMLNIRLLEMPLTELEESINAIGFGPQGMGGDRSVMGVNVVNTARHPATLAVAVTVACWSHRRGCIVFDKDLNYRSTTHSKFEGGAL